MNERWNDIGLVLTLIASAILSGCNAFTQNYQGERFERVSFAHLVESAPVDARKIGESRVLTYERLKTDDAVAAAEEIGAHYVIMSRIDMGERDLPVGTTMMVSGGPGGSPIGVNLPVPVTRLWYEYVADFYRGGDDSDS